MAKLLVTRISNKLRLLFGGLIANENDDSRFLSKALASFYLKHSCGITSREAVDSLTDGYQDCGIDAIFVNQASQTLILVQSKFTKKGTGSIGKDCVLKFLEGLDFLVDGEFHKFNAQVQKRSKELSKVLFDNPYRIELIVVHTGTGQLSQECTESFEAKKRDFNEVQEILTYKVLNQHDLYQLVMSNVDGDPINFDNLMIYDWGRHGEPHQAYYGKIEAAVVGEWWKAYGVRLLIKNIRQYKKDSAINNYMIATLTTKPDDFWYFNNGIIILCREINKALEGGSKREKGRFHISGAQIVNGAQTFGCIGEASMRFPDQVADARVFVKIIELPNADDPYYKEITRYSNTQNKIADKDFAALDPRQERIRLELKMDNIHYSYKHGDLLIDKGSGFDLEEAAVALACNQLDINYAVMSKGSPRKLWEDIDKPPYTILFNESINGMFLWRLVQVVRMIDSKLDIIKEKDYKSEHLTRSRNILTYGNRVIAHKVLSYLPSSALRQSDLNLLEIKNEVDILTVKVAGHLNTTLHDSFAGDTIQAIFRNQSKNKRLSDKIDYLMGKKDLPFS